MEIELYIERSIVDIARKCHVKSTDVIEVFLRLYNKQDNKQFEITKK
jgi:hypothetical protein